MSTKTISLWAELDLVRGAVEASRLLAERLREAPVEEALLPVTFPHALLSALALVETRLRDLGRLIGGHVDPEQFWTRENAFEEPASDEEDIGLSWSSKRRVLHLKRELKRARARRRWEQQPERRA